MSKKAIILLSGGLDSATTLAIAKENNYECYALSVNYHQRHNYELIAAKKIAKYFSVKDLKEVEIDLSWLNNSALTNNSLSIPENLSTGIPITYVPARHISKNLVKAGVSDEILIQVGYAIGIAEPVSLNVNTCGKSKLSISDSKLSDIVNEIFDLKPHSIESRFKLRDPIYLETASYGHMGRKSEKKTSSRKKIIH